MSIILYQICHVTFEKKKKMLCIRFVFHIYRFALDVREVGVFQDAFLGNRSRRTIGFVLGGCLGRFAHSVRYNFLFLAEANGGFRCTLVGFSRQLPVCSFA